MLYSTGQGTKLILGIFAHIAEKMQLKVTKFTQKCQNKADLNQIISISFSAGWFRLRGMSGCRPILDCNDIQVRDSD